ncbi:MAG TPA: UDP-N-acetylmuramoyl-L-alanine--D-glutamate ligase [Acidimicrobiales bacterium]|jgi:UDP-N-acetylmuramoylalanine--D-glutamate ligase|nr:UDP-N-acetylmuramoyl-L-alanine--D-glutamate ligase [Acidimicrobiales bacterium]
MPPPPPLSWDDLATRRVGIWGWGIEGRMARARLGALGVDPVVVDDDPRAGDGANDPGASDVVGFEAGGADALAGCEVVVKSPGVSRWRPEVAALQARGVQVVGGLGLWMQEVDRSRVAAVTGSKGKSTTVSVMGHLLDGLGQRAFVGGNLGVPPYAPEAPTDVDWWVVETSSYQATDLWSAPPVVAVTSLHPDHLDWHGTAERYYADKLSMCRLPGAALTVANGADPVLRARAGQLGPRVQWVDAGAGAAADAGAGAGARPAWVETLGLVGEHNVTNALIARACLFAMGVPGADDDDALAAAAAGFEGLPSRLRSVGVVEGVEFVDDSLSTNVGSTAAALSAFASRAVALIVGGFDRGIDYQPLGDALRRRRQPTLVLTVPDAGARIGTAVRAGGLAAGVEVSDMAVEAGAVDAAFAWARARSGGPGLGAVVLLSPAAPSYGHFADYRERSAAFVAAMRKYAAGEQPSSTNAGGEDRLTTGTTWDLD